MTRQAFRIFIETLAEAERERLNQEPRPLCSLDWIQNVSLNVTPAMSGSPGLPPITPAPRPVAAETETQ